MSGERTRVTALETFYDAYLANQDSESFTQRVLDRYTTATLVRLIAGGPRRARRAAALALGFVGGYQCNEVLGHALNDRDRGVRMLAENALRIVWCQDGTLDHQHRLGDVIALNASGHFDQAVLKASVLLRDAPKFAEVWNQRAIAFFSTGRFKESIGDCRRTSNLNPYHFGAVAGLGQCYLQLGNPSAALEYFRRALSIYPDLEGIRANVTALEKKRKSS